MAMTLSDLHPGNTATVARLVQMIRRDIRERDLREGDRYLTTEEVATLMNVAKGTANRAMQQLARENLLVRNRKLGTYIGQGVVADSSSVDQICLLIRRAYYLAERERINEVVGGTLSALTKASVELSLAPDDQEMVYAERLIRANEDRSLRVGYFVASKSPQIQSFFQLQGVPALIMGTPYPQSQGLASIDLDQDKIGRLAVRAAFESGDQRIAVILRDRRGFGDDIMVNAITAEAMSLGVKPGDLVIRSVPSDAQLSIHTIQHLMTSSNPPSAIITRSRTALEAVACVMDRLDWPETTRVISADWLPASHRKGAYACVKPYISAYEQGVQMGKMISALIADQIPDPLHTMVDVSLEHITEQA
ncbi:MAG: GntR family transcriptional regulator [Phycisphaeraceae bacterium]